MARNFSAIMAYWEDKKPPTPPPNNRRKPPPQQQQQVQPQPQPQQPIKDEEIAINNIDSIVDEKSPDLSKLTIEIQTQDSTIVGEDNSTTTTTTTTSIESMRKRYDNIQDDSELKCPIDGSQSLTLTDESSTIRQSAYTSYGGGTGSVAYSSSAYSSYGEFYSQHTDDTYENDDDDENGDHYSYGGSKNQKDDPSCIKDISETDLLTLEILLNKTDHYGKDDEDEEEKKQQQPTPYENNNGYEEDSNNNNEEEEGGYINMKPTFISSNPYISGGFNGYSDPVFLTDIPATQQKNQQKIKQLKVQIDPEDSLTSWNTQFQKLQEMPDCLEKFEKLSSLEHDFVYAAETYGRIIISEHFLPDEIKTIKPVSVGGIAGGHKYIVHGIMFKFAVEIYGLYGSDENAMKTAAHELNGCTSFLNCGIKGLHVPLMAFIDYRGFRLMAMSLLPISKSSLIYGSSDAGQTVHTSNTIFNHLFTSAAKVVNLKPHLVQDISNELKTIYGPIDIEGHIGTDGRFYLLDFARLSPPEPPTHRGAYLYKLLRLEFVCSYTNPLCSDAFSPMVSIGAETHNHEVKDAFDYLYTTIIPKVARLLDSKGANITDIELPKFLHGEGINVRHLGQIRYHSKVEFVREYLLIDAYTRSLKSLARELLRREMKKTHLPSDYPYKLIILKFLNLIFGEFKDSTEKFWDDILIPKMEKKFRNIFMSSSIDENGEPISKRMDDPRYIIKDRGCIFRLLIRFTNSIGLVIRDVAMDEFRVAPFNFVFVDPDIIELKTMITRLNIIDYADGMSLYYKSILSKNSHSRNRLLSIARERLEKSLHSMSTNYSAIFQLGNVIRLMAKFSEGTKKHETYAIAETTYASMEKLRIDQNLLYLSKLYRAKTNYNRADGGYYNSQEFIDKAIQLSNEAAALTHNKILPMYIIGKTLCLQYRQFKTQDDELFQKIVNHFNQIFEIDPTFYKAHLLFAQFLTNFKEHHKFTDEQITEHYHLALKGNQNLVRKLEPVVEQSIWKFFEFSRNIPLLKKMIISKIESTQDLIIPPGFELLKSDADYFNNVKPGKFFLKNATPTTIESILHIFTDRIKNLNLLEATLYPSISKHLKDLTNLTILNIGRCPTLTDEILSNIITPSILKIKIYDNENITDKSIKKISLECKDLAVIDMGGCIGITDESLSELVDQCPNIIKLGLPIKTTTEFVQSALGKLNQLKQLDLYKCSSINITVYKDAFTICPTLKKLRGSNGFPYFIIDPQILHLRNPTLGSIGAFEIFGAIAGYTERLFSFKIHPIELPFHSRQIHLHFNNKHPLVKFRDPLNPTFTEGMIKVGHYTTHEKPQVKYAIYKNGSSRGEWTVDQSYTVLSTGNLNYTFTYHNKSFSVIGNVFSNFVGLTYVTNIRERDNVVATISNQKHQKLATELDIRAPLSSQFLGPIFAFNYKVV
eukprot:gene5864-7293_t